MEHATAYGILYLCMVFQFSNNLKVCDMFVDEFSFNEAFISASSDATSFVVTLRIFANVFRAFSLLCFFDSHLEISRGRFKLNMTLQLHYVISLGIVEYTSFSMCRIKISNRNLLVVSIL